MHIQRPLPRRRLLSLTPLIDVVFILLLFFMLASSFIEWRMIGLNVPGESATGLDRQSVLIRVGKAGMLLLNGDPVVLEDLGKRIQTVLARDAMQPLIIQPEADVPLQRIVTVLDRLTAAGGRNISLMREVKK